MINFRHFHYLAGFMRFHYRSDKGNIVKVCVFALTSFYIPDDISKDRDHLKGRAQGMCGAVHWSWVIPFAHWIGKRQCLEIMSGRGLLAFALQKLGVRIIPTDNYTWTSNENYDSWYERFTKVENLDCLKAIRKYGPEIEILIMSWPPYDDPIAYKAIKALYKINREALVVYIGESSFGHTADKKFFHHYKKVKDPTFRKAVKKYQSWYGQSDYPHLGRFKP